jgi:LDH2 family malate/lactate/ureidoglycolate dehydrogenase
MSSRASVPPGPYTPDSVVRQAEAILRAWGMSEENIRLTADAMLDCDLRGIDTHGISLLVLYDGWRKGGGFNLAATDVIERDGPTFAHIDAQGGLGFPVSVRAVRLACRKAKAAGIAAVTVHNSRHFGAAGYYARLGAADGLIMLVATSTKVICVVPPGSRKPVLGTNPIAYGIPRRNAEPIVFDMATSTAAGNRIRLFQLQGKPLPEGWVVDEAGEPVTDAARANDIVYNAAGGGLTPLGANPVLGYHKGYGLALLSHFLGGALAGGGFAGSAKSDAPAGDNIGHFFLAIDPAVHRDPASFAADIEDVVSTLIGAPPVDPARPVLMPGDIESATFKRRRAEGIPLAPALVKQLEAIADDLGVAFHLTPA